GLYHADERLGPGVLTYADGRQDMGLWHRCRLLSLCTRLEDAFSLRAPKPPPVSKDPLVFSTEEMLKDERFILPPATLRYSIDPDHLPLPPRLRRQLDELFFNCSSPEAPEHTDMHPYTHRITSSLPLQERMQNHINRHRFEAESVDWDC
ncbi:ankyrin repeat and MYND domain-containing protein 1-like, partial [Clupea harengus]|uniref:Ankyrin repeat and MYND domain-containing protein 1-like n=1 Tax=Clupea harengus TaxID=7950 RepID=A0A8M1KI67_CLUHA